MTTDTDFFIVLHEKAVVVHQSGLPILFSKDQLPTHENMHFFVGSEQKNKYYIVHFDELHFLTVNYSLKSLRQLLSVVSESLWSMISKGAQLIEWYQSNRFCPRCGHSTTLHATENAAHCSNCDYLSYPRINPCIMVLIKRDSQILLAKSSRHQSAYYSLIAGFIEAGESAEEAIHREVYEEVGLTVGDLQYVCSQPWPFPHSLMFGFTADYVDGDINIAPDEIADAMWIDSNRLCDVKLPDHGTLSRKLIDIWRSTK